jgi:hypothetical protein
MEDAVAPSLTPKTVAEYKAAIAGLLAEMARLNEQMRLDQTEIDRLRQETALLRDETRALLATIGTTG